MATNFSQDDSSIGSYALKSAVIPKPKQSAHEKIIEKKENVNLNRLSVVDRLLTHVAPYDTLEAYVNNHSSVPFATSFPIKNHSYAVLSGVWIEGNVMYGSYADYNAKANGFPVNIPGLVSSILGSPTDLIRDVVLSEKKGDETPSLIYFGSQRKLVKK